MVAIWGLLRGSREGSLWALIGGLLLDLLSGAPFGLATLSLLAVGALCGLQQLRMFQSRFLLPVVVVAASVVVHDLVFLFLLQLAGRPVSWADGLLYITLPGTLLSVCLVPIVYPALRLMSERTEAGASLVRDTR